MNEDTILRALQNSPCGQWVTIISLSQSTDSDLHQSIHNLRMRGYRIESCLMKNQDDERINLLRLLTNAKP